MRILMTCALDVWALSGQGGAPSLFKTLAAYAGRGHTIDFISPTVGANHQHGAPPALPPPIDGVTYHRFHLPSLGESRFAFPGLALKADQKLRFALLFPYLAARRAEHLLRGAPYDLLYGYEVHGVLAQRLLQRRWKLPRVARFQGTVMHPYLRRPLSLARKYEEVLALRTSADLFVMTDDGTRGDEVLAKLNPGSKGKTRFWRNGLDLGRVRAPTPGEARAAREGLGLAPDAFVLVTAARLARWKRIDRAIGALSRLRHYLPAARLLIVGDGEERSNLQAQASSLGLEDSVRFVGAVPQAEVQRYLWAADVFLSLNELSNVGNPLLEAMMAGCCILTLDVGDTRSLIQDGVTGVLLSAGDPERIARALRQLAAEPERRQSLGKGAREKAERTFWSWEDRLNAEIDAVEELARSSRPLAVPDV